MTGFDVDAFVERAAIREYGGGVSRFEAETGAAREQGIERWQAMRLLQEANNAKRSGLAKRAGNRPDTVAGKRGEDNMPTVQRGEKEENGPLPFSEPQA